MSLSSVTSGALRVTLVTPIASMGLVKVLKVAAVGLSHKELLSEPKTSICLFEGDNQIKCNLVLFENEGQASTYILI